MLDTGRFREERWRRAGASDQQIDALRAAHEDLDPVARVAEGERVDGVSDEDLAAELGSGIDDPAAGTVDEVLGRVGEDAQLAAVALSHEQAKPRPRAKLLAALTAVIDGPPEQ